MIISIEGNIGAGKTTLIEKIKQDLSSNKRIIFLDEPIDIWLNLDGQNMLEHYYKNQEEHGFLFESLALITRFQKLIETIQKHKNKVIITERSIISQKHCFMDNTDPILAKTQIELAKNFMTILTSFDDKFIENTYKFIYINTPPEKCLKRIRKRKRKGEETITIDYLNKIAHNYENFKNKYSSQVIEFQYSDSITDILDYILLTINNIKK